MKDFGIVQGSEEMAKPLIVGKTTVYVHDHIKKVETDRDGKPVDNLYEYHEVQYTKDEYIALQSDEIEDLSNTVDSLMTDVLPNIIGGE